VVVVGASSGIGRSLALEYAQHGAELLICARRRELLEQVADECRAASGRPVHLVVGDITQLATQTEVRDAAADRLGGHVDYLILNAGAISVRPILDLWGLAPDGAVPDPGTGEQRGEVADDTAKRADGMLRQIMEINVHAPAALAGLFLPILIRSRARVVVVSSMAGLIAAPTRSLYSASKHAVTGYFNAFRMEVQRHGVSVTIVYPGTVDTQLRQSAVDISPGPQGVSGGGTTIAGSTKGKLSPGRCAQQIVRAAAMRQSSLVTPFPYWISTVLYGFVPDVVEYFAKKKY
ncbi:NAD(P)-binding protein, partial [Martensiomyces pterosporus]